MRIRHQGRHTDRLKPDCGNPRERVFAEHWKNENLSTSSSMVSPTLLSILHSRPPREDERPLSPGGQFKDGELTQEEATAAATVIQWLGSNVGWSFLEECLRDCGYKIASIKA